MKIVEDINAGMDKLSKEVGKLSGKVDEHNSVISDIRLQLSSMITREHHEKSLSEINRKVEDLQRQIFLREIR